MIRRPPRSTLDRSSAASDVYKRQLTHRSIAIPDSSTIEITVSRGRDAAVHCDGQAHFDLAEGDRVTARRAPHTARFLHPAQHDYFAMLREKLHWSETPERLQHAGGGKRE